MKINLLIQQLLIGGVKLVDGGKNRRFFYRIKLVFVLVPDSPSPPPPLLVTLPLDVPLTEGIACLVRGSGVEFFLESQIFLCLSCVTSEILNLSL